MFETLRLPPYSELAKYEGKGNYAIWKYYAFPYRFFYRKKLKMIVSLMNKNEIHHNILDYGSGPGIFTDELKRHALFVKNFHDGEVFDPRWRFDAIVCASVLEFTSLKQTLSSLYSILNPGGKLYVASPMNTAETRFYFRMIEDRNFRHSHLDIISSISKYFRVEVYKEWFNLYFALRASKN